MSTRTAELLMALLLIAVPIAIMWNVTSDGLQTGWVEGRGPGAGMWPFWLSALMLLASIATLVRWFMGVTPESRDTSDYIDRDVLVLIVISALSILGLLIAMVYLGTYIALLLFMFFYVKVLGGHSMGKAVGFAIGTPIVIYLVFEVALTKYLPKGLPVFENAFLWVDNFRYEWFY